MPEPTLPERLLDAAVDAMPYDPDDGCLPLYTESGDVDRWVPVECVARDVTAAVLRELETSGVFDPQDAAVLGTLSNEIEEATE